MRHCFEEHHTVSLSLNLSLPIDEIRFQQAEKDKATNTVTTQLHSQFPLW